MPFELIKVNYKLASSDCVLADCGFHVSFGVCVEFFLTSRFEGTGAELGVCGSLEDPVSLEPSFDVFCCVLAGELLDDGVLQYIIKCDIASPIKVKRGVARGRIAIDR